MDFDLYTLLKIVHIVTVVVGIGTVTLNGLYGAKAKAAGPNGGAAIGRANYDVSMVAEYFIYAIPVTGILMMLLTDEHPWEWSQTWVWLSIVLYVVALGISHAVVMPSHKRMNELMASGPPTERISLSLAVLSLLVRASVISSPSVVVWPPLSTLAAIG